MINLILIILIHDVEYELKLRFRTIYDIIDRMVDFSSYEK